MARLFCQSNGTTRVHPPIPQFFFRGGGGCTQARTARQMCRENITSPPVTSKRHKYQTNTLLTIWRVELLPIFRAPPYRVDVWTIVLTPVVIGVVPLVKVNQEIVANHVRYRSNADQIRVLAIYSF